MTTAARTLLRGALLIALLAGSGVWTSCDLASAGRTVILNADSSIPPTVRHRFEYTREDATEAGRVEALSTITSADDLDDILAKNLGASRADVASARVDSVRVERLSAPSLRDVTLLLGTNAEAPSVASVQFASDGRSSLVDDPRRAVTGAVRNGAETLLGQFRVETSSDIPDSGGMVRAVVYYRIEVEGV